MNVKRLINFHYNQSSNPQAFPIYSFPSQHIVTTTKVLKFTYQNASQKPIHERITSFPSASYAPSVSQLQYRPSQSIKSSKKINLVTKKHQRVRTLSNVMPQSASSQLQEDQKVSKPLRSERQSIKDDNSSVRDNNPEAGYTYKLRNHIQSQQIDKPYCQLFSICNEPNEQQAQELIDKFKAAKDTTISQQVKCQSKDSKPIARLPIFQSDKISQFIVQEVQKMDEYEIKQLEPEAGQIEEDNLKFNKISSIISQNRPFQRKSLFEPFQSPQKQNIITILEESIDINDIPDIISKNWQNTQPLINQWHLQSQSKQSNSKQKQNFQHFQ